MKINNPFLTKCELINNSDISAKEFLKCLNDCFITQNVIKPTFQTFQNKR